MYGDRISLTCWSGILAPKLMLAEFLGLFLILLVIAFFLYYGAALYLGWMQCSATRAPLCCLPNSFCKCILFSVSCQSSVFRQIFVQQMVIVSIELQRYLRSLGLVLGESMQFALTMHCMRHVLRTEDIRTNIKRKYLRLLQHIKFLDTRTRNSFLFDLFREQDRTPSLTALIGGGPDNTGASMARRLCKYFH